ncbi:MAG TPA: energy transducer TonB [Acidobacteriaceae bacterium]|jgi:TonB family protein
MPAPLRSANSGQQQSVQFAHFGVLDAGSQSKASTVTSLAVNVAIGFVVIVLSLAHKQILDNSRHLTQLVMPVEEKKPEPVKPKIPPPKPPKPLPEIVKVEEPKIVIPKIKLPEVPKQPVVKMDTPKPIITPAAPKQIIAMAAPVAVNLAHPQAASVPNSDPHPTAVQMGHPDMPFKDPKGAAVSPVNMNSGFPGMNAANTGHGPPATKVVLGNGSPESTTVKGNGVIAAVGLPHGVPGGTGTGKAQPTGQQISLGQAPPPPAPKAAAITTAPGKAVTVISKPKPEYTAEARQMHIEGVVTLRIRVSPNGAVEVVAVAKPLGYGLDDSAKRAIMATKFEPATDSTGHPIPWEGLVNVTFQLAS